jgi:hypothetical protein
MVIKHVFETGGKTLQELTNFPSSGGRSLLPPPQRCQIAAIGERVIAWTAVTDGADPEEADLP